MTEQEKQEIVSEVEKQILEKMKGTVIREDTQSVLKKPRSKWFTSASCNTESIMYKLFGTYLLERLGYDPQAHMLYMRNQLCEKSFGK